MKHTMYRTLIAPRHTNIDTRRRELLLNTLLVGLLVLSSIASLITIVDYAVVGIITSVSNVIITLFFTALLAALLVLSRRGHTAAASIGFLVLLLLIASNLMISWSYRLPESQLLFLLTVIIAGVLFSGRMAVLTAAVTMSCALTIAGLEIAGAITPRTMWLRAPLNISDLLGFIVIMLGTGIVAWLTNGETDRSLRRARTSEAALAAERDGLELKVIERTRELEDLQASRLLELQPFAEFGRIGASLVHEIANPLTAATMQLEALSQEQQSELVRQAQRSLQQLEKYLVAARKQIRRESDLRVFGVGSEIKQIVQLLTHRARRADVQLEVSTSGRSKLYGDVVKFDQLVANLIANAIDASQQDGVRIVQIVSDASVPGQVAIEIRDHGVGLAADQLQQVFQPFYSTKQTPRNGLGLGLALVKQYVEGDFRGHISVTSSSEAGTAFTVILKGQKRS